MTPVLAPYNHSYPFNFGLRPNTLQWGRHYGSLWPNANQRQEVANLFIPPNWPNKQNFLDYTA